MLQPSTPRDRRAFGSFVCCLFVLLGVTGAQGAESLAEVVDSPMYRDPVVPVSRIEEVWSSKSINLWLRALERPETDMKRQAADDIVLAHKRGVKGLDKTVAGLRAALDRPEQHPVVRLAVARALLALDVRAAAASLWQHAKSDGGDLADLVEPVLARWGHRPARTVWLERLRNPAARTRELVLAIGCLETVGEERAVERLRELVLSPRTPAPVRLQAARALGAIRKTGLEKDAQTLAADATTRGITSRLAAAALVRWHTSQDAVALQQRLTGDREPAVTTAAAAPLVAKDPKLVLASLDHLLGSPDAGVRLLGVEVLFRLPDERHVGLLGRRLDDFDPDVRLKARQSLRTLAGKKELRQPVLDTTVEALAEKSWRGQEQSAILLAQLDHKPAAQRLVELLSSPRPEVFVAAAWGLRNLSVRDTLPAVVDYVRDELERQMSRDHRPGREKVLTGWIDNQLAQLNQFLGQQKYAPADSVLRKFVPKITNPMIAEARAGAIWALGKILEGKTDAGLATALTERLNDIRSIPPEAGQVRWMAAVTLARIKATESLPSLRMNSPGEELSVNVVPNACSWAVAQLTGQKMPPARTIRREVSSGWTLMSRE
jgi:HEAT repeat protein